MDWSWMIVEEGAVDAVCMESPDRVYRDVFRLLEFVKHCKTHGVELWFSGMEGGVRVGPPRRDAEGLVHRIYGMLLEGKSIAEVAATLNESEVLQ